MSEVRDSAIKLFGKTIPLPPNEEASISSIVTPAGGDDHKQHCSSPRDKICDRVGDGEENNCKRLSESELPKIGHENSTSQPTAEELKDPATSCEDPKTPSVDQEPTSLKDSKNDEQSETNISQEKTLKKPDKIIPCPRCNSMDTKFCYYNNYNVNQPRHFCKNCQRYWTSGGTMRNVPVGSGRRKNKSSSASHYRHIMISDALQAARSDAGNGIHHPSLQTSGSVLTFGSDAPLCESMASALNLAEKSHNRVQNGFHRPEQKIFVPSENGDDRTSKSSITASDSAHKGGNFGFQESAMKNFHTLHPQVPYFPGPAWPCQWSSPQWRPGMPPPGFGAPPGFPVAFYPAPPYWGCTLPGPWNVPWLSPPPDPTSPNSPTLGKHSRDGSMLNPSNSEREESSKENDSQNYVWIPKTLRFDDPSQAAKSSILSTLNDSVAGGGLFKAFHSKGDAKNQRAETSLVLQANPAALSRSLNFRESA